ADTDGERGDRRRMTADGADRGRARRRWGLAIFVAVLSVNMLSSSREPAWGDARGIWEVATQLVAHQAIDITTRWPEDIPAGQAGKYYSIMPLGPAVMHVPGAALAGLGHQIAPSYDRL